MTAFSQQSLQIVALPVHEYQLVGIARSWNCLEDYPCSFVIGMYPLAGPYLGNYGIYELTQPALVGLGHPGITLHAYPGSWWTVIFPPSASNLITLTYRWEKKEQTEGADVITVLAGTEATHLVGSISVYIPRSERAVIRCTLYSDTGAVLDFAEAETPWLLIENYNCRFVGGYSEGHRVIGFLALGSRPESDGLIDLPRMDLTCGPAGVRLPLSVYDADVSDTLTISLYQSPGHGSVHQELDGSWFYTPYEGYEGLDYPAFVVRDGQGGANAVMLVINVSAP